jgi:hypothetical protein
MRKIKTTRAVVFMASMSVPLAGCTWMLMSDFQKGTEIAEFDLGKVHNLTKSMALPEGEADFRFVVRDYDCKEPLGASISVKVQFAKGGSIQRDVNLDEITWPVSGRDCHPIGYLRRELGHPLFPSISMWTSGRPKRPFRSGRNSREEPTRPGARGA